jgi:hypothetical protein
MNPRCLFISVDYANLLVSCIGKMINLFKIKGQKKDDSASTNGKHAAKKQSPGELRLHKGLSFRSNVFVLNFIVYVGLTVCWPIHEWQCGVFKWLAY